HAETIALAYLMLKGYRPLARRYGGKGGEIDLIVRRGGAVVFVEVKARDSLAAAAEAIGPGEHRLFARVAAHWLTSKTWADALDLRADAVLITRRRWPVHIVAAFDLQIG